MPLITVWNSVRVAANLEDLERSVLRGAIRMVCLGITELGLTKPEDITVRYPDLGDEPSPEDPIIVVVELLFDKPERTPDVRQRLAMKLFEVVKQFHINRGRAVEVAVKRFNPERDAFWRG